MGIRRSAGKNKKSKATTVKNAVAREGAGRQSDRARGEKDRRPGAR
jgi:hypothetical protein